MINALLPIIISVIFAIIIFPIFININLAFSLFNKKLYFSTDAYGVIKIISGYASAEKDSINVHFSQTKAKIIPYKNILGFKESVKPFMDYHFVKLNVNIETGIKDALVNAIILSEALSAVLCQTGKIVKANKPQLNINNSISVYDGKNVFNVFVSATIILNGLMLIISMVKILTEKLINAKRKQQNECGTKNRA